MAHISFAETYRNDDRTNRLTVAKFGGTSLMEATRLRAVAEIVRDEVAEGKRPLVVVSAMGKTTNWLIAAGQKALETGVVDISEIEEIVRKTEEELNVAAKTVFEVEKLMQNLRDVLSGVALLQELSEQTKDCLMSFGERISSRVFAGFLNSEHIKAKAIDAFDAGMVTSTGSGSGESEQSGVDILRESYDTLRKTFEPLTKDYTYTPVLTGFVAKNKKGVITTLGRSGSDYTAAVVGAAISAREIEIWTDVDGVLTADPAIVPNACVIDSLTFQEASELAYFGARVIHPGTIAPAMAMGIPVRIRNSFNRSHQGTVVISNIDRPIDYLTTALTVKRKVHLVDINSTRMLGAHGFLAKVFSVFSDLKLSIDVIATSEVSVSLTLERHTPIDDVVTAIELLRSYAEIVFKKNMAILTIIGNVNRMSKLLGSACKVLEDADIPLEMVSCGASKVNISLVVADSRAEQAISELHAFCFPSKE